MRILLVTQIVDADSTTMDLTITQAIVKSDLRREVVVEEYNSKSLYWSCGGALPRSFRYSPSKSFG